MENIWSRAVWREGDQEEEGVIPTVWVKDHYVMWPKGNVLKAMKEMRCPENNWLKFDLVKVKFSSAKKKECEKYDLTTTAEFSSSEEEDEPARRARKRKHFEDFVTDCGQMNGSDAHEETQIQRTTQSAAGSRALSIPPPPPKRRLTMSPDPVNDFRALAQTTVASLTPRPGKSPRKQGEPRLQSSASKRTQGSAMSPKESSDESENEALPSLQRKNSPPTTGKGSGGYPMSTERFQRKVIQILLEIRDIARRGDFGESSGNDDALVIKEYDDLEEFLAFDDRLRDSELQAKMKAKIRAIGGVNAGDHVKNAMKKCMTNALMAKMNMKGKKGKFAFVSTNVCKLVKESILQSHHDTTETKIYDEMARFLKYAPGRIGGGGRAKE